MLPWTVLLNSGTMRDDEKLLPAAARKMITNFEELKKYEAEDNTTGTQELACTAGSCEIVDITTAPVPTEIAANA